MQRNTSILLFVVSAIGLLTGCAQQVVPAGQHAPTKPESVQLYEKKPTQYEELGLIEVPIGGDIRWDDKGDSTRGFMALREKAAALGATGVLLDLDKGQFNASVTAGDGKKYYIVPLRTTTTPPEAIAQAIYVLKP